MKSTKDQFEQHVQGLYDGLEVPAPESTKEAVFNALDKQDGASWSTTTKTLLVAATIILGAAWFMMPEEAVSPEAQPTLIPVIKKSLEWEEEVYEEAPVTVLVEEIVEEVVEIPSVIEVVEETKVVENPTLIEDIDVEPNEEDVVHEEVQSAVHPAVEEKAKDVEPVNEDETEEWVLPATIKVEK